ncbi:insecticidal delta-endotoxin Cry8Ea1 family protein [Bacillus cereus]|nr:insecticidal delta-endotoxin Cry8Ea1 family protein [Bacillus cereus]
MNRNNQNDYEVIDASNCGCASGDVVKYPLTNDPNAGLQNINYKEYLQMSDENYTDSYINPSLSISGKSVIQVGINIVGRLLSFFGFPFANQVVAVYSYLLNTLWPNNDTEVWESFMAQVEELVDQKISEAVVGTALDHLSGLNYNYELYVEALEEWLERPNAARANLVFNRFTTLDSLFTQFMPSFGSGPGSNRYADSLLSVYAQAANLHLLFLKDADIYGARWGLNQTQIDQYHNRQQTLTRNYTNHCVTTFNDGLEKIRNTSAESWFKYNQYRREMTLMAMDLVALFPYYNVREYSMAVNPQLTREVYTDPIAFDPSEQPNTQLCRKWYTARFVQNNVNFSQLENAFIRSPHLFERLHSLEINFINGANWWWHKVRNQLLNNSLILERDYGTSTVNSPTTQLTVNTSNADIYQVRSRAENPTAAAGTYYSVRGVEFYLSSGVKREFSGTTVAPLACQELRNSIDELPSLEPNEPIIRNYSHRLSHITWYQFSGRQSGNPTTNNGDIPTYVWTHRDVDFNNTITPNRITQIPWIKASEIAANTTVVKGPGFTGGDILRSTIPGTVGTIRANVMAPLTQQYRIRLRYASTTNFVVNLFVNNSASGFTLPSTMVQNESLTYESFNTEEVTRTIRFSQSDTTLRLGIFSFDPGQEVYVDKLEIVPINPAREAEEDLEAAKKAVASLFTRTRDGLQVNVTDYQVDQAANLVSCLSDEQYGHDKKMLLEAVRAAKRLSRERNLLQDPDFNEINSTEENGWKASSGVTISEGGPFFKGRALQLASARENYPTYIYQKVDASVLKPYTRYRLDGFVKSSQDLEIDLIHHHKVHLVKNVPDNLVSDTYSDGSCSGINRCDEQHQVDMQLDAEHHPMDCCEAAQTHEFSSYTNTGDLNARVDQGIWVVLKVRTTDGYATLGNLELVEVGPLSGESLEREQRDNAKWNAELERKRAETDRVYLAAKQAINHLFVDYQDQQLNPEIGLAEINEASNLVKSISGVYSDTLLQIPGINYEIYTELSDRLQQASYLYTSRNAVQNGDFNSGLDSWNATTDASVQQDGNMHFLVLSHWDAQVSQQLRVNPNCKYVLRVTARKVGGGDGYVTIRDGAHHQETLTFNACDYDVNGTYVNDNSYITKEVVFYPETKHMWVEVSESEGSFYIDSIEFIETQE